MENIMTTVKINGMKCDHCSGAVTKALESIEGITDLKVDLEKGKVSYLADKPVAFDVIKAAITKIGFEVEGKK